MERVIELSINQVHDPDKGSFYVGLKGTRATYKGNKVYSDAFGHRITVVNAMGRPITKKGKM